MREWRTEEQRQEDRLGERRMRLEGLLLLIMAVVPIVARLP